MTNWKCLLGTKELSPRFAMKQLTQNMAGPVFSINLKVAIDWMSNQFKQVFFFLLVLPVLSKWIIAP